MIRSSLVGLWVCGVTLGAGYLGALWQSEERANPMDGKTALKAMAQVRVKPVSVPVVRSGVVSGYIVAQFTLIGNAEIIKKLPVKPEVFVLDAAYKGLYGGRDLDITNLNKESWADLAKTVKDAVNGRYGTEILHDVLLEEFGYVSAEVSRKGPDLFSAHRGEADKRSKTH